MRMTFVLPYAGLAGGIRVVAIYAERLRSRGHEVRVVSVPRKQASLRGKVKSVLRGRGWPARVPDEPSYFDGLGVEHHVLKRSRPVEDADLPDADVIVATWWETAEWVDRVSARKGAKVNFLQHFEAFPGMPKERVEATWRMHMHKIVISKWLVELARERFGDSFVSHVPNSVDTRQFQAPIRARQTRPTVGLLYGTHIWKGVDVALSAVHMAREHLPELTVVAFGAERESEKMPLPCGTRFHFQPPQVGIRDIYAKCDVWLCGSRAEGFHLPPLEAMACRCPVVSTRVGGPMDIIRDGVNGFLVDIEDDKKLANRLERVLTMRKEEWRAMSDAAYATAHKYTWDDATDLFERALKLAIERNERGDFGAPSTRRKGAVA